MAAGHSPSQSRTPLIDMYSDGNFSKAEANGGKNRFYPFEGDNASFYTEQEWIQDASAFKPLKLNTIDPTESLCYLVRETDPQDIGGGLVKWQRVYSRIPATRSEYETISYTFPGYMAKLETAFQSPFGVLTAALPFVNPDDPGRVPLARKVTCRVQYDYFLVGFNGAYPTASLIPTSEGQRFVFGAEWPTNPGQDLPDRILYHSSIAAYSSPTVEEWRALVLSGTEVVAEDSEVRRWRGNIFERSTRYLVAQ